MQIRLLAQGGSISGSMSKSTKQAIIKSFKDSPSYKSVLINGIATDVRIIDGKDSSYKTMLLLPDTVLKYGEYIYYNLNYWLVTDFVNNEINPKALIQKCNHELKWQDSNGLIHIEPCIATRSLLTKMDIKENNKYGLVLLEGEMNIYVQSNINTCTIMADNRFYIGSQIYKVTGIDDVSDEGLLRFAMKIDIKNNNDNKILRICDYLGNIDFNITNISNAIIVGDILQIQHNFIFNGNIINNPGYTLTYSSSNSDIATISTSGLVSAISNGNVVITVVATCENNLTLTKTFEIIIQDVLPDNYIIAINGNSEIYVNSSETYTSVVMNNGVEVVESVTWIILSGNEYGIITSQGNNSCVVKNIGIGTIVLKAILDIDNTIIQTKIIECKGLW